MRARLWLSVVMLLAGVGLAAAAGFAGPEPTKGGTLRISEPFDVGSIDPALAYRTETFGVIEFATCAKLYSYPDKPAPQGAIVIPEVAKGFPKLSKDGKTQTIELRPTYRFHTGRRITAANFVAAFNRDASPKLQSPATAYLHEIVGADAVIDGKARTIAGVRALSPYRLQIRTNRPLGDLVSRLTMPFFCPIATTTPLQEIDDPLGSGPYYVAARIPDRQIVLKRNRFYHGRRPAKVDQVVWTIGAGPEACRLAVEQNETDYCVILPATAYKQIANRYGINRKGGRFFFHPALETDYFAFNHDRPAFKGPGQIPLKQAINWAIDRRNCGRGRLPGRHAHRPDPAAGHGSECEHLPARGRHPGKAGKGTGPPRQGEVQAREAGALHEQRALLCLRSADLAVQPQAARDRRRGPVLLDSSRARESRYPRGTL